MNLIRTTCLAAVAVLSLSAAAQDSAIERYELALGGEFEFHQTDHWIIAYTTEEEKAEEVGIALEKLHKVFLATFAQIEMELGKAAKPLEVVLYEDRESYDEHQSKRVRPRTIPGNGAYSTRSNRIEMIVPSSRRQSSLINLAVHEGAHQLSFNLGVQSRRDSYPPWVGEGLASAFETRDLDSAFGPLSDIRNPRWRNMALRAETGRTMPIDDLIALKRPPIDPESSNDRSSQADNSAIYNQGASVIVFMMREWPKEFAIYLKTLEDLPRFRDPSGTWREAFKKAFGETEAFEEKWKEWLADQERGL